MSPPFAFLNLGPQELIILLIPVLIAGGILLLVLNRRKPEQ